MTTRYVLDAVAGGIAAKQTSAILNKYVTNVYIKQFAEKLGQEASSSALRRFFMSSVPKFLQKWNIFGKVGGAVSAGVIGAALDTIIKSITGAILRDSLQEMTREVLDYRFRADKNLKVMEVVIDSLQAIDNLCSGANVAFKMAKDFMLLGYPEKAYEYLA